MSTCLVKEAKNRIQPKISDAGYIYTRTAPAAFAKLKPLFKKKIKILDVGCGQKIYQGLFPNAKYIGIDNDPKTKADTLGDANALPYRPGSFDLVIASELLEHVPDPEKVISELLRVCKKGGYLYISTPFLYPVHDKKHDYLRFSPHFYKRRFAKHKIVLLQPSNTYFSVPLALFNALLSNFHTFLFIPLYIINNILALICENIGLALRAVAGVFGKRAEFDYILFAAPLDLRIIIKK